MSGDGYELAEGLFWYAEKLMWGYEDQVPDHSESVRLYRQAADLGFSDARIRLGEAYEHGRGVPQDANKALTQYRMAAAEGNFLAYAFIAKLLAKTKHRDKADVFWDRFFDAVAANVSSEFVAESIGSLIHAYIGNSLRWGVPVAHLHTIRRFRDEVIGHHQRLLEHASSDEMLNRLDEVQSWLIDNLS